MKKRSLSCEEITEVSRGNSHPMNVKPMGQRWFTDSLESVLNRASGLGTYFCCLSEDELFAILSWLDVSSLSSLICTSRLMRVYCFTDSIWKDLCLNTWKPDAEFEFEGTWRGILMGNNGLEIEMSYPVVFSDALYKPWQYACADIQDKWLEKETVTRVGNSISVDEFVSRFESPGIPLVIEGSIDWACIRNWRSPRKGVCCIGDYGTRKTLVRVGPVDMRLTDFLKYAAKQNEESPLYLFDCKFVENLPGISDEYQVPNYFKNSVEHPDRDLLEMMGNDRPDYRWLIAGAAKSGSKWHIDPNGTHAWNVTVNGSKRWIMYPPNTPPPGVTPSDDGGDVTAPLSLMEWFVQFYHTQKHPVEFTSYPGDIVFVPAKWWHCVLNLEPCVAITQNYISSTNLRATLDLLKNSPHLVSGIPDHRQPEFLFEKFEASLKEHRPHLLDEIREMEEKAQAEKQFKFSFFS